MYEIEFIVVVLAMIVGWLSTIGVKSQWVRLIDVFLIGPVLIFAAFQLKGSQPLLKYALLITGAATVSYNFKNYLEMK